MATYEIKKINKHWAVYRNGEFLTWFSTKRVAKNYIEIRTLQDRGEVWNPLHPRWAELMH